MVFSSSLFLFLFVPIFFLIYFVSIKRLKNIVVLIGSIIFYGWGGPTFLGTLIISLIIDWYIVNKMHKAKDNKSKKKFFFVALIMNIGLLAYFKYLNFFLSNINIIFENFNFQPIKWISVVLPIGISFIVFHKISYIIEIYRGEKKPTKKISDYFLYILLFPMSIAGPIIKYKDIADQLKDRQSKFEDVLYGCYRFSIGLFKKVWIADNLSIIADEIFRVPTENLSIGYAWFGIISYAFQIYFDFSGYADMAIGLSRIMGFKVMENFNMPYISKNITEFWRRWHISLSSWMKAYIYIPLGGNRCSKMRNYFNLWIVFFVSGLWHGASWTFVIWGGVHGIFIVCDKLFWVKISEKLPKFINIAITFILVLIAWVFFRADTIHHALGYLISMFKVSTFFNGTPINGMYVSNSFLFLIVLAFCLCFIPATNIYSKIVGRFGGLLNSNATFILCSIPLLALSIIKCVTSSYSAFIYFRF